MLISLIESELVLCRAVGVALQASVTPFLVVQPTDAICTAIVWFAQLSFILIMGTLFVVTWRVHRLFAVADKLRIVKIPNRMLLTITAIFVVAYAPRVPSCALTERVVLACCSEIILLILFSTLDPQQALLVQDDLRLISYTKCEFASSAVFPVLVLGSDFMLLAFGAFLGYEVSKIPQVCKQPLPAVLVSQQQFGSACLRRSSSTRRIRRRSRLRPTTTYWCRSRWW